MSDSGEPAERAPPIKVTYRADNVFIQSSRDKHVQFQGYLCLLEKEGNYSVQWQAHIDEPGNNAGASRDHSWTMVNAVGYRNDVQSAAQQPPEQQKMSSGQQQEQQPQLVVVQGQHSVQQQQPQEATNETDSLFVVQHMQKVVSFEISQLRSVRRITPNFRASRLQFILDDGTTTPQLIFQKGGSKAFVEQLQNIIPLKETAGEKDLYQVVRPEVEALSRSFEELQLFNNNDASSFALRFLRDPYSVAMSGLAKVTKFVHETLLPEDDVDEDGYVNLMQKQAAQPQVEVNVTAGVMPATAAPGPSQAPTVLGVLPTVDAHDEEEPEYAFITARAQLPLKPPHVERSSPLTLEAWQSFFDEAGRVHEVGAIKELIFRGGLCHEVRRDAWKFLLGYYRWDATEKEREEERKHRVDDYFRMKLQWKTLTDDQAKRFSLFADRKALIEKDVNRTDRTHRFYAGEGNENLIQLRDILMTYVMYNFNLGYVQGMSDLLSPILVVMENEVDAFWCFERFMNRTSTNFELDQKGMKKQLLDLNRLLQAVDPDLYGHLDESESGNMYFAFRWLLVIFKREFNMTDIMRLWEVYWTDLPCPNFHLLLACAILTRQRSIMVENKFGFTEILKHVNDLSGQIDLEDVLRDAEAMYMQLSHCPNLSDGLSGMLGLSGGEASAGTSDSNGGRVRCASPSVPLQTTPPRTEGEAAAAAAAAAGPQLLLDAASEDRHLSADTVQPFS